MAAVCVASVASLVTALARPDAAVAGHTAASDRTLLREIRASNRALVRELQAIQSAIGTSDFEGLRQNTRDVAAQVNQVCRSLNPDFPLTACGSAP